ncbi:MAG: hypothetical protein GYB67_12855, partial [Chloroflexi bacterium]|nr:hypothetical protein [Chloroflexota bacterium]
MISAKSAAAGALEPGLLPVFRVFVGAMWAVLTVSVCAFASTVPRDYFSLFAWLISGGLLIYLLSQPLQRWLGRDYLPGALAIISVGPLVADAAATALHVHLAWISHAAPAEPARLYLWLIPPAMLISLQYGTRTLLAYAFGTSLLPVLLATITTAGEPVISSHAGHGAIRLTLFLVAGFIVVRITQAQRQQRQELAEKNAQLAHYATTLEQLAVTQERNRLAREMHDTLAHTL